MSRCHPHCAASSGLTLAANQRGPWIAFGARNTTMVHAAIMLQHLSCARTEPGSGFPVLGADEPAEPDKARESGRGVKCFT